VSKVLKIVTPFRIALGFACLFLSLLIVVSTFTHNVDRMMNSKCGFTCGYILDQNVYFNPMDFLLLNLSKYLRLDSLFLGMMLFYFFISSLFGIVKLGIRLSFINMLTIKKRKTSS